MRVQLPRPTAFALGLATLALLGLTASRASANPRALPFTDPYATLPCGGFEMEQYIDAIPLQVTRPTASGGTEKVTTLAFELQTEFELGLTDRLELGAYLVFDQPAAAERPALGFKGSKQRLRYRFAEAGQWPVDLAIYFEAVEFRDEIELEQKVILGKRFGKLNTMANLTVEQEYEWLGEAEIEAIFAPSGGLTYDVSPSVTVGAEYWGNLYDGYRHYAGPTAMFQKGDVWMSGGVYARLDDQDPALGDPYGRLWIRLLGGVGF